MFVVEGEPNLHRGWPQIPKRWIHREERHEQDVGCTLIWAHDSPIYFSRLASTIFGTGTSFSLDLLTLLSHWNGCFALRPSHGVLDTTGLTISFECVSQHGLNPLMQRLTPCRQFDTPSFFCRDIHLCKRFATAWYGSRLERPQASVSAARGSVPYLQADTSKLSPRLVVPSDYMRLVTNPQQLKIIKSFVIDLEKTMNVEITPLSFGDVWAKSPPVEAGHQSLDTYMKTVGPLDRAKLQIHSLHLFRPASTPSSTTTTTTSPPSAPTTSLNSTRSPTSAHQYNFNGILPARSPSLSATKPYIALQSSRTGSTNT